MARNCRVLSPRRPAAPGCVAQAHKRAAPLLREASHDVLRLKRRRGTAVVRKKTSSTGIKPTPPSRLPATVGDKPISCVERCTPRSRARYGRLSARIAVSRRKSACCTKDQASHYHRWSIRGGICRHVDTTQIKWWALRQNKGPPQMCRSRNSHVQKNRN